MTYFRLNKGCTVIWKRRHAAAAGDQLENGNGEFGLPPFRIHFLLLETFLTKSNRLIRNGIGHERFVFEVGRRNEGFACQWMMPGNQGRTS